MSLLIAINPILINLSVSIQLSIYSNFPSNALGMGKWMLDGVIGCSMHPYYGLFQSTSNPVP